MSRRDRLRAQREASIRDRARRPRDSAPRHDAWEAESPDPTSQLERLTLALLPLRAFLGVTFVYAGVDKLTDPNFLQATGPGSIGSQLEGFVKVSPIAPLVQIFGQPFPVAVGLLIAITEIAIGLGALSGLLFRLSAVGGLALSLLFWLTASWATKPYYYGPDLPYALGWLTLALAGTGGRFTIEAWLDREFEGGLADEPVSPERRLVLKAAFLGGAALVVAALAGTVGASVLGRPRMASQTRTRRSTRAIRAAVASDRRRRRRHRYNKPGHDEPHGDKPDRDEPDREPDVRTRGDAGSRDRPARRQGQPAGIRPGGHLR